MQRIKNSTYRFITLVCLALIICVGVCACTHQINDNLYSNEVNSSIEENTSSLEDMQETISSQIKPSDVQPHHELNKTLEAIASEAIEESTTIEETDVVEESSESSSEIQLEESVEVHMHQYQSCIQTPATCEKDGVMIYECACGNSYTKTIAATGHSYSDTVVVVEPTYESEGYTIHRCETCGYEFKDSFVEKLEKPKEDENTTDESSEPSTTEESSTTDESSTVDNEMLAEYPYASIEEAATIAKTKIFEFYNMYGNDHDYWFELGVNLPNEMDSSEIADIFFDAVDAHTGKPEEGDALYGKFQSKGCVVFSPRTINNRYCFTLIIYGKLNNSKAQIDAVKGALDIGASGSTYQRAKAVYDWITTHCTYGSSTEDSYQIYNSAYGARFATATCNGISQLTYDMMLYAGVPCRIVHSVDHAWNIVQIDGTWYIVDCTFGLHGNNYFLLGSNNYSRWAERRMILGGSYQISSTNYGK